MLSVEKLCTRSNQLEHGGAAEDRLAPHVLAKKIRDRCSHLRVKLVAEVKLAIDIVAIDQGKGTTVANPTWAAISYCCCHHLADRAVAWQRKPYSHHPGLSTKVVETGLAQEHECFSKNPIPITGPTFRAD